MLSSWWRQHCQGDSLESLEGTNVDKSEKMRLAKQARHHMIAQEKVMSDKKIKSKTVHLS